MAEPHDRWWVTEYGCPPTPRQTALFQHTLRLYELGRALGRMGASPTAALVRSLVAGLRCGAAEREAERALMYVSPHRQSSTSRR